MLMKRSLTSPEGKPAAKKQDLSATLVALSDVHTTTGTESVGWGSLKFLRASRDVYLELDLL